MQTAHGIQDLSIYRIWPTYGLIDFLNQSKSYYKRPAYVNLPIILGMLLYIKDLVQVFSIPPDNDDSSVNLALLGLMKETNSSHFQYWNNFNFNKIGYYKKVLKYAYRPFDQNYQPNKFAD